MAVATALKLGSVVKELAIC
ncbi:uncharacterized protein G2W53_030046 [Senna tora]|uniref:Uncharacterized protein n=1 Tax=Senna tora TaxID=362788 RepID=A0A834SBW2_9FABA|nr:uncharacterized protein G2W53_044608 [Senna tora]KAF7816077.1 uncharacterized protein G2W53_030046 [Senna tora]